MLAGGGPDVRIPVLTWESFAAGFMLMLGGAAAGCPAGVGHNRLVAAPCAQYVPKFAPHLPALRLPMGIECAWRPGVIAALEAANPADLAISGPDPGPVLTSQISHVSSTCWPVRA